MNTLQFNRLPQKLTKTLLLSSFIMSSLLQANDENEEDFSWAYQLREEVQQVPPLTELRRNVPKYEATRSPERADSTPWGAPKNLLNPLPGSETGPAQTKTQPANNRNRTSRSNQATSSTITVNINQDEAAAAATDPASKETERSQLEQLYGGQFNQKASRDLEQFGYAFFEADTNQAMPTGPTPQTYTIGAGDEIILSLSGSVEAYHKLAVDADGQIDIPEFGVLPVTGVQYGDLDAHILRFLEERRLNFELTVSLGKRRAIQVNIIGRVAQPGLIEVPAMSNLILALGAAGGVEKNGTLRNIILTRHTSDGTQEQIIDLYEYLRNPSSGRPFPQLQERDIIYIPSIGKTVGIAGYVQEPAIYEIKGDAFSVRDALSMAGGLTPFSFTPLAQIERTVDGRGRKRVDISLDESGLSQPMQDGELLMIEAVDDKRQSIVRIEGEIARPGDYEYTPGMTISDLIGRADGLTVDAYIKQAFISRQVGETATIEAIPGRSFHGQSKRVLVTQLDKALSGDALHDLTLQPLDLITIRSRDNAVTRPIVEIIGSVQRPGKYELTASMRVSDLIAIAGNLTPEVYYDEAELIRRSFDAEDLKLDVKRYRFDLKRALGANNHWNDEYNPILSNGDKLVIRSLQNAQVRVRIDGRVRFPGEYIFPDGAQITDLIEAAGGVLDDADLRAGVFTRQSTRKLQQSRLDNLIERTRALAENSLERLVQRGSSKEGLAAKIALERTRAMLNKMSKTNANGRIVIPFHIADFPTSPYNLPLQEADALTIPRRHPTVSVSGDVFRPVTFIVTDGISVKDALEKAGGLTEMADEKLIYVIRANGEIERSKRSKGFIKKKTMLYAGDVLLAPTQPMERTLGAQFSDLVMLSRQLAEIAVITTNGDKAFDVSLVSPFNTEQTGLRTNADAAVFLNK